MTTETKAKIFHSSNSRGLADHGWLISRHTFSFASYYNPERVNFGALRVLNDDVVKPGQGFGTHPHDNMEIISIPISGSLAHKDSTGKEQVIKTGEVQIMSAGSGLYHSEYNHSQTEEVNFLQIWIMPKERNIAPRYNQMDFSEKLKENQLVTVVSPESADALWINQDAELSLGKLTEGTEITHRLKNKDNGIYAFLIEGEVIVNDATLKRRDAVGFFNSQELILNMIQDSTLLLIEVPHKY